MRQALAMAILTVGSFAAAAPATAQTYAPGYPVCLHVYGRASYIECSYMSLAQCNASASGRSADCETNPYAANALVAPPAPRSGRHRRVY